MLVFQRGNARGDGDIQASASAVWELLTDWGGVQRWYRSECDGGGVGLPTLTQVVLTGGLNSVPRTRVLHIDGGSIIRETVLAQDDQTRRLYYDMDGEVMVGVRNYVGTVCVDENSSERSILRIRSSFDVVKPSIVADVRRNFESMYENSVFAGFRSYFELLGV